MSSVVIRSWKFGRTVHGMKYPIAYVEKGMCILSPSPGFSSLSVVVTIILAVGTSSRIKIHHLFPAVGSDSTFLIACTSCKSVQMRSLYMSLYNKASISADHTIIHRKRVLECFAKMRCLPHNSSSSVVDSLGKE